MEVISSLVNCLAAVIVAAVAVYGIRAWKQEFRGKRQIELAEEVLALFYEARDAITDIRSPLSHSGEWSTREPTEKETPAEKHARDMAYVVFHRYEKHQEVFNRLFSMRYRFMAQIGKDKAKPFEEVRKIVNQIFSAARRLTRLWVQQGEELDEKRGQQLYEKLEKYEAIFWFGGDRDETGECVEKAVSDMEETCSEIIMRKPPLRQLA